ncbi:hypothetical protein [Haliangium sp.]|uniref:hypothetical protein n=1 Tax=Haliangium sp. TaxID=2663208 RepID=UPI003D0A05D9
MSFIRNTKTIAAVSIAALLFATACKKDEESAEGKAGEEGAAKHDEAAKGAYAYMPKEANFVIGVNPAQLAASSIFKQLAEPMIKQQAGENYDQIQGKCISTVQSVTVGGVAEKEDTVVVAVKGMDKAALSACAELAAAMGEDKVEISDDGGLTKVVSEGETAWIGWLDDKTMVMGGEAKDKAVVEALVARKEGLSDVMAGLVGNTDTKAGLWFAMQNPKPSEPMGGMPYKVETAHGSINLASGIKINVGAKAASPEDAQKMVEEATGQLSQMKDQPPFGKYVAKAEIKADGANVNFTMALSDEDVNEIIPVVQQQVMPMLMMMMMSAGGGMDGAHGGMDEDMGDDTGDTADEAGDEE